MISPPTHTHTHTPRMTVMCLSADSSETQFTWLQTLEKAGVEILPAANEEEERIKNATSIFDFEAKTIDGEPVSLDKYR